MPSTAKFSGVEELDPLLKLSMSGVWSDKEVALSQFARVGNCPIIFDIKSPGKDKKGNGIRDLRRKSSFPKRNGYD